MPVEPFDQQFDLDLFEFYYHLLLTP
jgi:hypothetical protein